MNVLVAGGAGYIGSHTVKRLKEIGHTPVIYDNLSRGHKAVAKILRVPAVFADLGNRQTLVKTLRDQRIDTVMHFAALAYVGESVQQPLAYYHNNVAVTVNLLQAMQEAGVNRLVFSSTCATYGEAQFVPITENHPLGPVSPYGRTKLMVEQILADVAAATPSFSFAALRYFNAAGCALDGSLGEDHDPETHLIPVVLEAILSRRPHLEVFGTDYPTPDGTNIRDYIHVEDLAEAHILAMEKLAGEKSIICNLGTGHGHSVKQIIQTAETITGHKVPVAWGPRRPGDAVALWADATRARTLLGWQPKLTDLSTIITSAWAWFSNHPRGYSK